MGQYNPRIPDKNSSSSSSTTSRNGPPSFLGLESVNVYQGRPDISQLLPEQAEATRGGRMSVTGALCFLYLYCSLLKISLVCGSRPLPNHADQLFSSRCEMQLLF